MIEISVALVIVLFALWIGWRWKRTSVFTKLGIPGPKPSLLFGNLIELYQKGPLECQRQWVEKYGRILGYYYGMRPIILITDPDMIKTVLIKDFNKFPNRMPLNPLRDPNKEDTFSKHVLNLKGQRWKEMRSVLTPTFSTAKMKQMSPSIGSSVELLISKIKEKAEADEEFDIHELYQRLTMDVICRTAFGINIDVQNKNVNALRLAQMLFDFDYISVSNFIGLCFPGLRRIVNFWIHIQLLISNRGASPARQLLKGCERVIKLRRSDPMLQHNDLLQLMLDAKISYNEIRTVSNSQLTAGDVEAESETKIGSKGGSEDKNIQMRNLTDDEVSANAFLVFLAGYETTSTALSFASQLLVHHPDIQDKIYEEVEEVLQKEEKLDYSSINQLPYLDKVINEAMRIYPPVLLFVNRVAIQDVKYDNMIVQEGMQVQIPVFLMHHDPEFWPDPETFDPERFSTKPNTLGVTYLPFGGGPRNCLGMRFAQMEVKMALSHLLNKFKLYPSKHTEKNITIKTRLVTSNPKYGVPLKAVLRENETSV